MKLTISVPDLQYAMRTVKDVVPTSGPLAETMGVLISAKADRAVFTAFNPEMIAKAIVKASCEEVGDIAADANSLYNAVSSFKPRKDGDGAGTSDITLISSPKSKKLDLLTSTYYSSGSKTPHKKSFPLLNHEFFPELPSADKLKVSFQLQARLLMEALDNVAYAVSSDKSLALFTSVLMRLRKDQLTLFATNGVCLAEYTSKIEYSDKDIDLIIPGTFASKISKSFFDDDVLLLSLTDSMLFLKTPNVVLGGTLIKDNYPDYKAVMPTPEVFALVNKHILLDNLRNLMYEASTTENSRVTVTISGEEAFLSCGGSINSSIPAKSASTVKFDCNLRFLLSSISNVVGDMLKIGFSGSEEIGRASCRERV